MNPDPLAALLPCRLLLKVALSLLLLEGLHSRHCQAGSRGAPQQLSSTDDSIWHSSVAEVFRPPPGMISQGPVTRVAQRNTDRTSVFRSEVSPVLDHQSDPFTLMASNVASNVAYPNYIQYEPAPAWHSPFGCEAKHIFCHTKADVVCDFKNFFNRHNMLEYGIALSVAASFANTSVDEDFRNWIDRQGWSNRDVDCWYREIGNGSYVIPLVLGTNIAAYAWRRCHLQHDSRIAQCLQTWGNRSMRSIGVGTPTLILTQWATGASRPGETPFDSEWKWFDDNNGASGHAFIGAIPFMVAADMTDRPAMKGLFYIGSGLAGYSRICDDAHYLSQVILGWTIAHISVRATRMTDYQRPRLSLVPQNINGDAGLGIVIRR